MAKEENFYHELDHKTKKRSFCTCQTLAIVLVVLAIALALGVATLFRKVATVVTPKRQVTATSADADSLQQKVADLSKAPGASTNLTVTEKELTGLLISGITNQPNTPFRDVQAQIDPDVVTLTGNLTEYLKTTLAISVVPKVTEDGKLKFEITKIQAGSLPVPSYVTEKVAEQIDSMTSQGLEDLKGVTVKSVQLFDGRMVVSGTVTP